MSEAVIDVRGLERRFGKTLALAGVDLAVPPGIVMGLVGENGAGKTTLIRHLLGLLKAQAGSVSVLGRDPVTDPAGVLGRLGYLAEERALPDWMTIAELLRYTEAFYPGWDSTLATELCETFRLDTSQRVRTLSKGQSVRTGLVTALSHRPSLVVLDEPSSGLDPVVRRDVLEAIIRTVADEGRTVLFSSHLLDEVERVSDHVAMIDQGRMILSGELDDIRRSHAALTVQFDAEPAEDFSVHGLLSKQGYGREWTLLCQTAGEADEWFPDLGPGASVVERRQPSLDEIFMAHVAA